MTFNWLAMVYLHSVARAKLAQVAISLSMDSASLVLRGALLGAAAKRG